MPQPTAPPHHRQLPEDLDNLDTLEHLEHLEHLEYLEWSGNKKTRGDIIADITSLRGRLPTLPLSQYHRRGEA